MIYRTLLLALKLLRRKDQPRILGQFCSSENGSLKVLEYTGARTEIGRRSFAARVKRLWPLVPEEMKNMEVKTRKEKEKLKEFVKTLNSNYILWGNEEEETKLKMMLFSQLKNFKKWLSWCQNWILLQRFGISGGTERQIGMMKKLVSTTVKILLLAMGVAGIREGKSSLRNFTEQQSSQPQLPRLLSQGLKTDQEEGVRGKLNLGFGQIDESETRPESRED